MDRRRFVQLGLFTIAASSLPACVIRDEDSLVAEIRRFARIRGDRRSVARISEAFADEIGKVDARSFVGGVMAGGLLGYTTLSGFMDALDRRMAEDFRMNRVNKFDGWILSRTEVEFVLLLKQQHGIS